MQPFASLVRDVSVERRVYGGGKRRCGVAVTYGCLILAGRTPPHGSAKDLLSGIFWTAAS